MRSCLSFYFCPLRSGSSGNVLFAQAGDVRLLIDAGLSGRMVESLLQEVQAPPDTFSGILVTHEHSDHIKGVGILSKRFHLPVYATEGTWLEMESKGNGSGILPENRRIIQAGERFFIHDLCVEPFSIPHDAREPVGYSLLYGGHKVSIATDLGHLSPSWLKAVEGADLLLLEANHDPSLLQVSRYPARLRTRIAGQRGHLSNEECGAALARLYKTGVRRAILGHLSGETNLPELAYNTVCQVLDDHGISVGGHMLVDMAWREKTGGLYEIGGEL